MFVRFIHVLFICGLMLATSDLSADDAKSKRAKPRQFDKAAIKFFETKVKPILAANCFKCHGGEAKIKGGLRLTNRASILKGGDSGPAVSLKRTTESVLIEAINYRDLEMPPKGKLPQQDIDILTAWVKRGLPWTPGDKDGVSATKKHEPAVTDEAKQFWSFQRVKRPESPSVEDSDWIANPIDAFILAKLEAANIKPAPRAEKTALLRRAYYDLTGLPPSPEAVDEFLAEKSPKAFEHVVDRLLDSQHYGERWGRHWLDLVRYAETDSYERDGAKPSVWRYRDYVIRSLNDDKPYDQFIIEQLAGDELENMTHEQLIATGYYRLGIWQDEPVDAVQELYEDLDDIVTTTGQVFLALTINCCRCHDHKLDPIPQRDYYRFMAFFHGINRYGIRGFDSIKRWSLRPIGTSQEIQRQKSEIATHRKIVNRNRQRIAEIEKLVRDDFSPVEKEDFKDAQNKIPIVGKRVPKLLSKEKFNEYKRLKKKQKELTRFRPTALSQALCITEIGPKPRDTFLLVRGNAHARGEKLEPGFPSVLDFPDPKLPAPKPNARSSGRRNVLANWIASPENPLTARVMVNRVWQYHFGRGIVRSPSNFGFKGSAPTHPKLLDWLASEFVSGGWKLKRLHKLIMLSNAYRMSSRLNGKAIKADPTNNLFWRFNMRRLESEEIRDSILAVNGSLNRKMFGPSIYPIIPAEVKHGQSRPGAGWGNSSPRERSRRSVYIHIKRSLAVPFMAAFDAADTDASCPVRFETTQPTQSLEMFNGKYLSRQAAVFADYLRKHAGGDSKSQVELALTRSLQRTPTASEVERGLSLLELLEQKHGVEKNKALDYYCLVVLNLNEFIYLD